MEQIQFLIQLLYSENESIRSNSEKELRNIFKDIGNIKKGFEQLLIPFPNQNQKLQYFIFLKNFIIINYDYSPNFIQKDIQNIVLEYINKVDQQLISFYCELLNFIIKKSLPSLEIIQNIINQPSYNCQQIKIITEMINNPFIIVKLKSSDFQKISNKMILYYNLVDLQKLNLLSDLYIQIVKSTYTIEINIQSTINHQFCEILTYHCLEYNLLRKFSKVVYKINQKGQQLPQEISTMLFDILMSTYMQNENQRISDKYLAYRISKVFKQLLSNRQIEEWKQESIIVFTMINLIMLEYNQYENLYQNQEDDNENDYLLIKIRKFGALFIHHMTGYFSEEVMIKQLFHLKDLISDDNEHEEFNCIKLEAHYYVINENISLIPMHLIDKNYIEDIITILENSNTNYIPLKMQILILLKKLLQKNALDQLQIDRVINTIKQQLNPNLIKYPLYICKIVNNLIYLHLLYPKKKLISHQTFADLRQMYQLQTKLIHKETILMSLCELLQLEQGDYSVLQIIEDEWKVALQEEHKYKYRTLMILNVLKFIIEIWSIQLLNGLTIGIIRIIKNCLKFKSHLAKSLSVFSLLLRKYQANVSIKCQLIEDEIKQIQEILLNILSDEQELFSQITQLYYLFLLQDVADYNLTFQFISLNTKSLYKSQLLSLICLLFSNLHQGQFQDQIIQYYSNILQEVIFDEGKTYSELICGLSILDLNQYDVKQILMDIQKTLPINKMINIMIFKATICIKETIPNYINYLINFFNCLLFKQNLMFDLEQLTIENYDNQSLKQYIYKMKQYLIPNDYSLLTQIERIFETKFIIRISLSNEIKKKFKFEVSKLQMKSEEEVVIENISIS